MPSLLMVLVVLSVVGTIWYGLRTGRWIVIARVVLSLIGAITMLGGMSYLLGLAHRQDLLVGAVALVIGGLLMVAGVAIVPRLLSAAGRTG